MNLLDKFHFKDKNGIQTTMEICDSFSRSKIAEILGLIPTKTSQLQNDSGFITSAAVPTKTSDLQNDSGFITSAAIPTNVSAFNNDAGYITSAAIPTNVSAFNNDAGYITSAALPTKTSDLQNDSGFITTPSIITNNGSFHSARIGNFGICHGFAIVNAPIIASYGSMFYGDVTISIPENCRLGWIESVTVTPANQAGLLTANVINVQTDTLTIRFGNTVSGAINDIYLHFQIMGGYN